MSFSVTTYLQTMSQVIQSHRKKKKVDIFCVMIACTHASPSATVHFMVRWKVKTCFVDRQVEREKENDYFLASSQSVKWKRKRGLVLAVLFGMIWLFPAFFGKKEYYNWACGTPSMSQSFPKLESSRSNDKSFCSRLCGGGGDGFVVGVDVRYDWNLVFCGFFRLGSLERVGKCFA